MFSSKDIKEMKTGCEQMLNTGWPMVFICIQARELYGFNEDTVERIHAELRNYGLTEFSGKGFGLGPKQAMLRRFMFLDFIQLYLQDEEAQRNEENEV